MAPNRSVSSAAFVLLVAVSPAQSAADNSKGTSPSSRAFGPPDVSGANDSAGAPTSSRPVFDPTKPIPPGFHVEEQPTSPLVPIGGLVFTLSYAPILYWGTSALAKGSSYAGCPSNRWLVLPLAGPFIAAGGHGGTLHSSGDLLDNARQAACEDADEGERGILKIDGVFQVLGVALLAVGLVAPGRALVKDTAKDESTTGASDGARWRLIPWHVGASSAGVDLVGTF